MSERTNVVSQQTPFHIVKTKMLNFFVVDHLVACNTCVGHSVVREGFGSRLVTALPNDRVLVPTVILLCEKLDIAIAYNLN